MIELREHWLPSQEEFDLFAKVSGDDNPIHVDPAFSARTAFGRTVSHGMLIYTRLWGMIRRARPGAVQISQQMMFPNPTYAGDEVVLKITGTLPGQVKMVAFREADGAELFLGEAEVA